MNKSQAIKLLEEEGWTKADANSFIIEVDPNYEDETMAWTEPEYSRNAIARAGDKLISEPSEEEYLQALIILNNWRASHGYPLKNLQRLLKNRAMKVDQDVLISQRLKRVPSILGKLKRFPDMRLDRMQDLGGCRAVVSNIVKVYDLKYLLIDSQTKSKLVKENDYITAPKPSGYRGIHLIYKHCGKQDSVYNRHLIEIQLRTKLQHAWATTVEIVGAFTKEALKSGEGSQEWLEFFKLVSILFSRIEGLIPNNTCNEDFLDIEEKVVYLIDKLSVLKKLEAFSVSVYYLGSSSKTSDYFLLTLDTKKQSVSVSNYSKEELDIATQEYSLLETEHKNNNNIDVVLVAAESLQSVKRAYPNYFADSEIFIAALKAVMNS